MRQCLICVRCPALARFIEKRLNARISASIMHAQYYCHFVCLVGIFAAFLTPTAVRKTADKVVFFSVLFRSLYSVDRSDQADVQVQRRCARKQLCETESHTGRSPSSESVTNTICRNASRLEPELGEAARTRTRTPPCTCGAQRTGRKNAAAAAAACRTMGGLLKYQSSVVI